MGESIYVVWDQSVGFFVDRYFQPMILSVEQQKGINSILTTCRLHTAFCYSPCVHKRVVLNLPCQFHYLSRMECTPIQAGIKGQQLCSIET